MYRCMYVAIAMYILIFSIITNFVRYRIAIAQSRIRLFTGFNLPAALGLVKHRIDG